MSTVIPLKEIPGVKYKAVLSNRIYLKRTKEFHDFLIANLTYVLPAKRMGYPDEHYCDVTRINDGVLTIPIGRQDLIPDFFEIEDKRIYVPAKFPKFKFELRESQSEVVDNITDSCLINANPSWGKAQPGYSKIRIPQGWTTMADIGIGDIVCTPDNKKSKVVNKFFHKDKEIYKITLYDGREVHACVDHLWEVYIKKQKKTTVLTTKDLIECLKTSNRLYLPLCSPISDTTANNLPLDPYVLGVLLGDGGFTTDTPTLSTADEFIVNKISTLLPKDHKLNYSSNYDYRVVGDGKVNKVTNALRTLKLHGLKSHEKFIPEEYKLASMHTKLQVLQGLFDADGSVEKDANSFEYSSTSKVMMDDVCEIIYSLGGVANIQSRITNYTYKGEKKAGRVSYRVRPSRLPLYVKKQMFSLPRKLNRLGAGLYDNTGKIRVESIEYINKQDCWCIEIDSKDKLYLTDNYIVTHNTFTGIAIACKLKQKTLVVVHTAKLRDQWVAEVQKTLGITAGEIGGGKNKTDSPIVIATMQSLKKRMHEVKDAYGTILLDECLDYETKIDTLEYGLQKIGKIVNNELDVHVKSWNGRSFEYKKVLRYFKNKHTEDMIKYTLDNATILKCTINHTLYVYRNGRIEKDIAGNVIDGDYLVCEKSRKTANLLTNKSKALALGCIIGDGGLGKNNASTNSVRISVTNGQAQKAYLEYKKTILNNICSDVATVEGKSGYKPENKVYKFHTLSFTDMDNWHKNLYAGNSLKSSITKELADLLTVEAWSLIYQDDGSINTMIQMHVYMDTAGLSHLINSLNRLFGVKAYTFSFTKNAKELTGITLNTVDSRKFIEQIEHLIHPDLEYKKGKYGTGKKFDPILPIDGFEPFCITKIVDTDFALPTYNNRYNIEVEDNHNYLANGKLVSNCHHLPAAVFKSIIDASRARYKIGLSATMWRKDGRHVMLRDYTGTKVFQPIDENRVASTVIIVESGIKFSSDPKMGWAARVNELMQNPEYTELVLNLAQAQAEIGHKTLVVGDRVEFLERCAESLASFQCIAGETAREDIDLKQYDGIFGSGKIFSEGVNEPSLSCLIMAYPINNRALLKQLLGRIERPHKGKPSPIAIDIALEGKTAKYQLAQRINFYTNEGYKIKYI